jgi:tetratricopeptide (TPR) repeat protein
MRKKSCAAAVFRYMAARDWLQSLAAMSLVLGCSVAALAEDTQRSSVIYERGYAYLQASQFTEAIKEFTEVIRLAPNHGMAYWGRGWARGFTEDWRGLTSDFTEAIRLGIDEPDMYYNRGVAWQNLGEHEKAIADFERAARLSGFGMSEQPSLIRGPAAANCDGGSNNARRIGYRLRVRRHHACGLAIDRGNR